MKFFAKYMNAHDDRPIKGDFEAGGFVPFTLLALHGFQSPMPITEARFLVDLMSDLAAPQDHLLICRNGDYGDETFTTVASQCWIPVPFSADKSSWGRRCPLRSYTVGVDDCKRLAEVLAAHWDVCDGHWLFMDWAGDPKHDLPAMEALVSRKKGIRSLRSAMLPTRRFTCMTFDDTLFDMYVNCELSDGIAAVRSAGEKNGVQLEQSEG